jgi:hypothetical protein
MKSTNLVLGMAISILHLVKTKDRRSKQTVESGVVYVDSLENEVRRC